MADLRVKTRITAMADRRGNVTKTRTWEFTNLSAAPIDLRGYEMYFHATSESTRPVSARDGAGNVLSVNTSIVPGGRTEIVCKLDVLLEAGSTYVCRVQYQTPLYFVTLRNTGMLVGLDQEEPQAVDFDLWIDDPRPRVLRWLFIQFLDWDAHPDAPVNRYERGSIHLSWSQNLRADTRGLDIVIAYKTTWIYDKVGWFIRTILGFIPKPSP